MNQCPPFDYLFQAANHCPKAVSTYMDLWTMRDKNNYCRIHQDDARIRFLSLARFRHNLKLLLKEGLLCFDEKPSGFWIELTGWEDWDDDLAC